MFAIGLEVHQIVEVTNANFLANLVVFYLRDRDQLGSQSSFTTRFLNIG